MIAVRVEREPQRRADGGDAAQQLAGQSLIEGPGLGAAVVADVELAPRAAKPDRAVRLAERFNHRDHRRDVCLRLGVLVFGLEGRVSEFIRATGHMPGADTLRREDRRQFRQIDGRRKVEVGVQIADRAVHCVLLGTVGRDPRFEDSGRVTRRFIRRISHGIRGALLRHPHEPKREH